ncbi:hypothetical protein Tco_0882946 [Tanacetum coccineum]
MTNGREETPPPGFSTLTPIPDPNVGQLPPITVSTFTVLTLGNTSLTNHASTSTNPGPLISPTYVKANYKALKSLLREHRKQIRNEDICTEQDYYNEEYDEEREMEPRPARAKETTLVLRTGSPRRRPSERRVEEIKNYGVNLPPLLTAT